MSINATQSHSGKHLMAERLYAILKYVFKKKIYLFASLVQIICRPLVLEDLIYYRYICLPVYCRSYAGPLILGDLMYYRYICLLV